MTAPAGIRICIRPHTETRISACAYHAEEARRVRGESAKHRGALFGTCMSRRGRAHGNAYRHAARRTAPRNRLLEPPGSAITRLKQSSVPRYVPSGAVWNRVFTCAHTGIHTTDGRRNREMRMRTVSNGIATIQFATPAGGRSRDHHNTPAAAMEESISVSAAAHPRSRRQRWLIARTCTPIT